MCINLSPDAIWIQNALNDYRMYVLFNLNKPSSSCSPPSSEIDIQQAENPLFRYRLNGWFYYNI